MCVCLCACVYMGVCVFVRGVCVCVGAVLSIPGVLGPRLPLFCAIRMVRFPHLWAPLPPASLPGRALEEGRNARVLPREVCVGRWLGG